MLHLDAGFSATRSAYATCNEKAGSEPESCFSRPWVCLRAPWLAVFIDRRRLRGMSLTFVSGSSRCSSYRCSRLRG
jgi:hypothetical protein